MLPMNCQTGVFLRSCVDFRNDGGPAIMEKLRHLLLLLDMERFGTEHRRSTLDLAPGFSYNAFAIGPRTWHGESINDYSHEAAVLTAKETVPRCHPALPARRLL